MVLLEDLDRHFSITISVAVRRVVLDVYRGEVVEVLDVSFNPYNRHLPSAEYRGMVATFLRSSFCVNGFCMVFLPSIVSVRVRAFSLETAMLHDGMELSELQIWLKFDPSFLDQVGAKRHIDTCSIPLVRVSGKTLNSCRGLSQFDLLQVAHLVNHAP